RIPPERPPLLFRKSGGPPRQRFALPTVKGRPALPVGRIPPERPPLLFRKSGGPPRQRFALPTVKGRPALPVGRIPPERPPLLFRKSGGAGGEARGRPPPPAEPRSGPWGRAGAGSA